MKFSFNSLIRFLAILSIVVATASFFAPKSAHAFDTTGSSPTGELNCNDTLATQSFCGVKYAPTSTESVGKVFLQIDRPSGATTHSNFTLHIYNDASPYFGTEIAVSSSTDTGLSTGTNGLIEFDLTSSVMFSSGSTYDIVLRPDTASSCGGGPTCYALEGTSAVVTGVDQLASNNDGDPNHYRVGLGVSTVGKTTVGTAPDTSTRIIDFTPENATTTSNPVTFSLHAYISPADIGSFLGIQLTLHNIDQNVLLAGEFSPSDIYLLDGFQATTSGDFYFSTTTTVGEGNYRLEADMDSTQFWGFTMLDFLGIHISESHQFVVGTPTFIGNISQNSYTALNGIYASTTATSTASLAGSCYPFSGQFSTTNCLAFLFIPDAGLIYDSLNNFKNNASTRMPLGYLTDFINILSTTTSSSLPVISATIPTGVAGAGSHISLSLDHSIDYILYASTSQFINSSAPDTGTLYDIVSGYWNKIVYLALGIYIITRIVGSHVIPNPFSAQSQQVDYQIDVARNLVQARERKQRRFYDKLIK